MTRDEAINELAELEPREALAWSQCEQKRQALEELKKSWQVEFDKLDFDWSPLFRRKVLLKSFLELTQ